MKESEEKEAHLIFIYVLHGLENKDICFARLVARRPSILGGGRRWEQKARGDVLARDTQKRFKQ